MQIITALSVATLSFIEGIIASPVPLLGLAVNSSTNSPPSAPARPELWAFTDTIHGAVTQALKASDRAHLVYIKGFHSLYDAQPQPYIDVYFTRKPATDFYLRTLPETYGTWSSPRDVSPWSPMPSYIRSFFAYIDFRGFELYEAWQKVQQAGWQYPLQQFEVFFDDTPFHQLYYRFQSQYAPWDHVRVGCRDKKVVFEAASTGGLSVNGLRYANVTTQ